MQYLPDAIAQNVMDIVGASESSITVVIKDVPSDEWKKEIHAPEMKGRKEHIYKKPDCSMQNQAENPGNYSFHSAPGVIFVNFPCSPL